jgi:Tfp pilus assembly protein PilF
VKRFTALAAVVFSCSLSVAAAAAKDTLKAPDEAKFKHATGLLDAYRGDTDSLETARTELDGVLKANPRYAPAYRAKARYLMMSGHIDAMNFKPGSLDAADAALAKAIEIDPNYAEAFVLRGQLYRLMDRHQDAVAALEKAERIGTDDPWLQNDWADLLIDEGKHDEAAARYRKVVDGKTTNVKAKAAAFEGLIAYYASTGALDQSEQMYRKQIELEPGSAWAHGNYAQFLLCQKDDADAAIDQARQALRIMNYDFGRYWLAAALYRKWADKVVAGTPDEGKTYFTEAQAIFPGANEVAGNAETCLPLSAVEKALSAGDKAADPSNG